MLQWQSKKGTDKRTNLVFVHCEDFFWTSFCSSHLLVGLNGNRDARPKGHSSSRFSVRPIFLSIPAYFPMIMKGQDTVCHWYQMKGSATQVGLVAACAEFQTRNRCRWVEWGKLTMYTHHWENLSQVLLLNLVKSVMACSAKGIYLSDSTLMLLNFSPSRAWCLAHTDIKQVVLYIHSVYGWNMCTVYACLTREFLEYEERTYTVQTRPSHKYHPRIRGWYLCSVRGHEDKDIASAVIFSWSRKNPSKPIQKFDFKYSGWI